MKAYIVESAKKIEPFGEPPGECLIANRKLSDVRKEVLQCLGIEIRSVQDAAQILDPEEHLILGDSLFFTTELVKEFIDRSRRMKVSTTCAIKPGLVTLHSIVATQDVRIDTDKVEYDLHYVAPHVSRGEFVPVVIDPEQFSQIIPMPEHIRGPEQYRIPVTDTFVIQVDHWANLWAANMAMLLSVVARLIKAPKLNLLWLALKARSVNRWKIFHQFNKIGKNCDIHPTAYIEGSTIGDNVMIGAGSVIRLSVIGDAAATGSNVTIESSVIGEKCSIDSGCGAFCSVLYPRTVSSSRLIFASVCGRDTFMADGSGMADFRIDGKRITVLKDGISINTGVLALGSCIGHGVYLGAASIIAPGIAIPCGLRIIPEKDLIISKINPDGTIPGHRLIPVRTASKSHDFSTEDAGITR